MDLDHLLTVQARATYENYVFTVVAAGIHIFMAFYGLCVFLEAPQHLRKGRKRYIATSFVIACIVTFTASLDMAAYFQMLFQSTSPSHWLDLMQLGYLDWKTKLSHTGLWILVWIGDALLVYRCYVMCVDYWWVATLPGATSVCALVFGLISTYGYDPGTRKYEVANALLTVSTNVTATALITFHVLRGRRTLAKILPLQDIRLYTGVVAILVESALPPSILGVITAALMLYQGALTVPPSEGFVISYYTLSALFFIFCTLSPQMIIFRVITGRSFMKFPTLKSDLSLTTDRWAHHTGESSFVQSSFSNQEIRTGAGANIERLEGYSSTGIRISVTAQTSGVIQIVEEKREKAGGEGEVER